jgi:exoribonuclease R
VIKENGKADMSFEIQPENLSGAFHGDIVETVSLGKKIRDRAQARVTRIISRAKNEFVGTIRKNDKISFLVPDDKRMYVDIFIPYSETENIPENSKVLAEITDWGNPSQKKNPAGKIIKIIGQVGKNDTEMQSIVLEKGFRIDFPADVVNEAEKIKTEYESGFKEGMADYFCGKIIRKTQISKHKNQTNLKTQKHKMKSMDHSMKRSIS